MLTPDRLLRRLRSLFTTRQLDDELDDELRFHLEMATKQRMDQGMSEAEARAAARRDFGGVSHHRDESRDARGVRPIEDLMQDLRVGVRTIMKQRTYAVVAILTLAIGIGATTALWAAVYRMLLQPYAFPEADRIVAVFQTSTGSTTRQPPAFGNYVDWKERSRSLDMLAAMEPFSLDWIGPDGPEQFNTALVTEDFFPIQGLRPLLGRAFLPEEFQPGRENVVVFTESFWRSRFGSDSSLIGRALVLDTVPRIVVGIMPDDVMRPYDADVFAPKIMRPHERNARTGGFGTVVGRLAPGLTIEQARAELDGVARQLAAEYPATNKSSGIAVIDLREAIVGNRRTSLLVLFGAVAFVLLIACVNVANLQLAEAVRRRRELAIRTAIGAGRGRLVRQLVTESMLVGLIGAVASLFVAQAGISAIRRFAPEGLWLLRELQFDVRSLAFALTLAGLAAVVIGILPVIATHGLRLSDSLAAGGRGSSGSRARQRVNRALVVSEVALALVLLVGAGLMLRSLGALARNDKGFRTDGILVTSLQAWSYYPTQPQRAEFVRQAVDRLAALPGVERVAMTSSLPLAWPIGFERTRIQLEGIATPPGDEANSVRVAAVTDGYFGALDIPIEAGRNFASTDVAGSPLVMLVNRSFARRFYGDENPVGKRVAFGFMSQPLSREIVGVVGDVRHSGLHADPTPSMWIPHAQGATGAIHLVVRAGGEPALLQRSVRQALREINGSMPLSEQTTMAALLSNSLRERRFQLGLFAAFSLTALVLSAIGIYGVMSRATSERTHEIGVRLAVGAQSSEVRWMVLRSGGGLAALGIIAGALGAVLLTRFMQGMLFGVTPLDPLTYVGAAVILLLAAIVASWLPAWRASVVDPVIALRND
jgi:putative ABC transport system permease protein